MNPNKLLLILHGLMVPILIAAFGMLIAPEYDTLFFIVIVLSLCIGNSLLAVYWFFEKE